ncbi:hypothetical protein NEOLEDRAFT_1131681 [Neolentinus lepideus HHB14362 ss-1]|uniref:Uncharacterized protein n=1 Tax=Neolentinus lepideus HHB14362 ss-1 TaxID=1314782 RepID=A0A165THS8_9AGAM|nr:hypothetical protein NEOLEDRAFT_1131681 [Neolentinus lepideus HHB14362 ss-1]
MIRREPTRIVMNDSDVQDIRDVLAKKRALTGNDNTKTTSRKSHRNSTKGAPELHLAYAYALDIQRQRQNMTRDQRLGLM